MVEIFLNRENPDVKSTKTWVGIAKRGKVRPQGRKHTFWFSIMPELARFLGIVIGIFPREHPPAHFHAVYGEYQITVDIETGVVHGDFPRRALRLVLEWFDLHQQELLDAWERVQAGFPPKKIAPLE